MSYLVKHPEDPTFSFNNKLLEIFQLPQLKLIIPKSGYFQHKLIH